MIGEILKVPSFADVQPYSYSHYIELPPDAINFDKLQCAVQDSNKILTNLQTVEIQFIDHADFISNYYQPEFSTLPISEANFLNIDNNGATAENIQCLESKGIKLFVPEYPEIKSNVNTEHLQDAINNAVAIPVSKPETSSESEPSAAYEAAVALTPRASRSGHRHGVRYKVLQVGKERLYLCSECQTSCTSLQESESHLREVHQRVSFVCGSCGLAFRRKCHLTRHRIEEHVGRILRCNHCDKEFKRQEHLNVHLRCVHTTERQFKCDLCDKAFYRADRLRRHRATHNKKPQNCFGCGKIFARKTNLLKHERSCGAVVIANKRYIPKVEEVNL